MDPHPSSPFKPPVFVRKAVLADSAQVLAWRNEAKTVAASPTGAVSPEAHNAWYPGALARADRLFLIGLLQGDTEREIGTCRFDLAADGASAEASINLAAAFHGQGLAIPFLQAGIDAFEAEHPAISILTARIKVDNMASRRCFSACGFVMETSQDDAVILHFIRASLHARAVR